LAPTQGFAKGEYQKKANFHITPKQFIFPQTSTTAEPKKMAAMAFANYKRRVSW